MAAAATEAATAVWSAEAAATALLKSPLLQAAPPAGKEKGNVTQQVRAPPADTLGAAMQILDSPETFKKLVTGGDPAADFATLCDKIGLVQHPATHAALQTAVEQGAVAIRGWECDFGTLCVLLLLLPSYSAIKCVKFWQCGLGPGAMRLLQKYLPQTVHSIAIEGDGAYRPDLAGTEAHDSLYLGPLQSANAQVLSLRCCALSIPQSTAIGNFLRGNRALTALSLYGCRLGDAGAAPVIAMLGDNRTLLALNLGANALTDGTARAIHEVFREPHEEDEEDKEEEEEEGEEELVMPNRTLTALNLSANLIGSAGRLALEAAQAESSALCRLSLAANPCLLEGPTACLSAPQRELIASSWKALNAEAATRVGVNTLCGVLRAVPTAAALFDEAKRFEDSEGVRDAARKAVVIIGQMVESLEYPESLVQPLEHLGMRAEAAGIPAVVPFDAFGQSLITSLENELNDKISDEAVAAWHVAYEAASAFMQKAYSPQQLATGAAARPAE